MKRLKKKVVIITTVHPPFDTRIFHKQAKTLANAGYGVTLIARHSKSEAVDGINILALPKFKNRFLRIAGLTWIALIKALKQKADIYHFHDPEFVPFGIMLKLITHAKVIYDIHEDNPSYIKMKSYIPTFMRGILSNVVNKLELFSSKIFDAIITADKEVASRFRKFRRIEVIHNFPDLEMFKYCMSNINKTWDVIYLGSISQYHLEFIISLADMVKRKVANCKWCIIGLSEKQRIGFLNQLQEHDLIKDFCVYRKVDYNIVPKMLSKAKIGIIPLPKTEKFMKNIPTKLFEYLACGLNVVASDLPPIREFAEDNECVILVPPNDVYAFSAAIEFFLKERNLTTDKQICRQGVIENYNWKSERNKLLKLYEDLTNELKKVNH